MSMDDYRSRIDELDREIVEKIEERMRTCEKIAQYKKENSLPVFDAVRERQKIDQITEIASDDMASYTRILYNTIMEISKDHQRKTLEIESPEVMAIKKAMEETPKVFPQKATVACQGVMGAYSQKACEKLFKMPKIMYLKNFNGVFAAVDSDSVSTVFCLWKTIQQVL